MWSKVEALEDPMNDYKMSNMAVAAERRTNNASNANRRNWWECCKIRSNRISVYEGRLWNSHGPATDITGNNGNGLGGY